MELEKEPFGATVAADLSKGLQATEEQKRLMDEFMPRAQVQHSATVVLIDVLQQT